MSSSILAARCGLSVSLASALLLAGCSSDSQAPAPPATTATEVIEGPKMTHDEDDDTAMIQAAFAELSVADRELALEQKTCPVSGDPLGGMGTPIKLDVDGRAVFVCCEGCRDPLLENPDEYLAKLDAAQAAQ